MRVVLALASPRAVLDAPRRRGDDANVPPPRSRARTRARAERDSGVERAPNALEETRVTRVPSGERRRAWTGDAEKRRGTRARDAGGWARAAASPLGAFAVAAIVSAANPTFMTSGREAILMRLYERERGGEATAYVRDGVLYRWDAATGSVTANADNGLMVDKNGGIWIVVPQKEDATLIKQKYYMGQIEDVPPLPKNASAEEKRRYDEYMKKLFDFDQLPNLKKVYDGPFPVPPRKEVEKFFREGVPMDAMDEIEGAGALYGAPSEVPFKR